MFGRIRAYFIGLAVLCITGWSYVISTPQPQEEKVTIQGTLEADDVDEDGTVVTVVISVEIASKATTEEKHEIIHERYLIAYDKKGRQLLDLVGRTVEATGTVKENEEGNKTIFIKGYRVLQNK
jgi:hypothetical protein